MRASVVAVMLGVAVLILLGFLVESPAKPVAHFGPTGIHGSKLLGAASGSGLFPTSSLNLFQDGDIINAGDWNAIEAKIGIDNSSVTSSLDYKVRQAKFFPFSFVVENPAVGEDDYLLTARVTSTISRIYVANRAGGDTATFNITQSTSLATATSSASQLFAAYTAVTATTTPSCYAAATTTDCSTGVFGTNASTTINAGNSLRLTMTAASSSKFGLTLWITEN